MAGGRSISLGSPGKQTIWIPAGAMVAATTAGCEPVAALETTAGRPDIYALGFDKDSDESAQFSIAMPKSYNGGTISFTYYWATATDAGANNVAVGLQGVAISDSGTFDIAYGTAVVVSDSHDSTAEDCMISAESGAITIAGSPAAEDICMFQIYRDVSADNLAEDMLLVGIKLFFTTDADTDD